MDNLFNTGIRPAVDAYLKKKSEEVRDYGKYWSASSAGYCQRKVIFDRLGVPKVIEDARKTRVFEAGHVFHEWIQRVTREAGISIAQEEELQDEELMIRGHFDDLVSIDSHLILIDYKTQHSRAFMWAKKENKPLSHYHKYQLATYMYMIRKLQFEKVKPAWLDGLPLLTESRLYKLSKDDLMMMEQQLLYTPDLEKEVIGYWRTLNGYWKKREIPVCTCHLYEINSKTGKGFMADEKYNDYFYQGEPCSMKWATKTLQEGLWKMPKKEDS